ncbi:MAG: transglutaminase domain-containing protein [Bacteroidaceae bacterium]|nr:transglutaminase domain-containing protein [Bacteroidaceae bacterium]
MKRIIVLFLAITLCCFGILACSSTVYAPSDDLPPLILDPTEQQSTTPSTSERNEDKETEIMPSETGVPETSSPVTIPTEPEKEETKPPVTNQTEPPATEPPTKPTEPPHEHKYTSKEVAPTCEKEGKTVYTCNCGKTYTETTKEKLGHQYTSERTESTCSQAGKTVYTCTRCTKTYSESHEKLDHNYTLTKTVESTTSKKGYKEYTCSACGKTYQEELPLKKGALETDMCGKNLWLKPLKHGGYYDFVSKVFEYINNGITYDEATGGKWVEYPEGVEFRTLIDWFGDTYRYAAYPFSYTVYRYDDGRPMQFLIWGEDEDYAQMSAVSAECKRILAELGITSSTTQKEAIIRINKYLCEHSYYEYDESKRDGSPYASMFTEGKVCHNYAMAFQMLCLHAGIECHYYSSNTMNHAWNKVYFSDGTYYWVDVCWNDNDDITEYLLLTTEQLLKSHSL